MNLAVILDDRAPVDVQRAAQRAAERVQAQLILHRTGAAAAAMRAAAATNDGIVLVAADARLTFDALASLRRHLGNGALLIGGRALVRDEQRLGAMFARPRYGPDPVEIVPIVAPAAQRLADHIRGPVDAPQRGAILAAASLLGELPEATPDEIIFLTLALHAFGRRATICEPKFDFSAEEDPPEVVRLSPRVVRAASWDAPLDAFHRDPPAVRLRLIGREVRAGGEIRGYERRPMPPVVALVVGPAASAAARAAQLRRSGIVRETSVCDGADGEALRAHLARAGDRYLLVVPAQGPVPERAALAELAERVESSGRAALALDGDDERFGLALFHAARISDPQAFGGTTVREVIRSAIAMLPSRRRFAVAPAGPIVAVVPALIPPARVDAIMVAVSRPVLARQSLEALRQTQIDGRTVVLSPSGFAGIRTIVAAHPDVEHFLGGDPHLRAELNAAIAGCHADALFIVRDDVNVPPSLLDRLRGAFARIPELGLAVPRIGAPNRPESLPDVEYRDLQAMRAIATRRAMTHARDAALLDAAGVPVLLVARRALERVGGFDPAYGFTRFGIEDLTRRLRSANFAVACVDDAFAHLHPAGESESLLAVLDDAPALARRCAAHWRGRDEFDPERDAVPLAGPSDVESANRSPALRVLGAVADDAELAAVLPHLASFATHFTVDDPLEVQLLLDGALTVPAAVAAVRDLLTAGPTPLERTLNVRIERRSDFAGMLDPAVRTMRLGGVVRAGLGDLELCDAEHAARLWEGARA